MNLKGKQFGDYCTLLEAAEKLKLSKSRVEQFVKEGRLKAEMFAGVRLVLKSDVAKLKRGTPGRPRKK